MLNDAAVYHQRLKMPPPPMRYMRFYHKRRQDKVYVTRGEGCRVWVGDKAVQDSEKERG